MNRRTFSSPSASCRQRDTITLRVTKDELHNPFDASEWQGIVGLFAFVAMLSWYKAIGFKVNPDISVILGEHVKYEEERSQTQLVSIVVKAIALPLSSRSTRSLARENISRLKAAHQKQVFARFVELSEA